MSRVRQVCAETETTFYVWQSAYFDRHSRATVERIIDPLEPCPSERHMKLSVTVPLCHLDYFMSGPKLSSGSKGKDHQSPVILLLAFLRLAIK